MIVHFRNDEITRSCRFRINGEEGFIEGAPFPGAVVVGTGPQPGRFSEEDGVRDVVAPSASPGSGLSTEDHVHAHVRAGAAALMDLNCQGIYSGPE